MTVRFSNNAVTDLAADLVNGATSIVVSSALQFPLLGSDDWMYITVDNEVIKVIARSGNSFTCEPVVGDHLAGATVELRTTAELLSELSNMDEF